MTNGSAKDKWAEWLLNHRFGGNEQMMAATLEVLGKARDRILDAAQIKSDSVVLDIGTGDGLLGVKALEMIGNEGRIIFSDISQDCLDYIKGIIDSEKARFLKTSATHLVSIADESIDRIVSRAVLIYIDDKEACFREFYRTLRTGGILSISEPISQFSQEFDKEGYFRGYDCSPIKAIAEKLKRLYRGPNNGVNNAMSNFNERDLFRLAADAGFRDVQIEFSGSMTHSAKYPSWETFIKQAPNPMVPTLGDAMQQILTQDEIREFEAYLRPKIENEYGRFTIGIAYLVAEK